MNYEMSNNKVFLQGEVASEAKFSHNVKGENFYSLTIKIPRKSGYYDLVPLLIPEVFLRTDSITPGKTLAIKGQFRSYNEQTELKRKLRLSVFVREVVEPEETEKDINPNQIFLKGTVVKPPIYRTTPFNREICDVLIAVNRAFNKSDYIPCIFWGRTALEVKNYKVGDAICLTGRIQSREYSKKIEGTPEVKTLTAYEVSADLFKEQSQDEIIGL